MKKLRKLLTLGLSACMFVATLAASVPQLTQIAHAANIYTVVETTSIDGSVQEADAGALTITVKANKPNTTDPDADRFYWGISTQYANFIDTDGTTVLGDTETIVVRTSADGTSTVKVKLKKNESSDMRITRVTVRAMNKTQDTDFSNTLLIVINQKPKASTSGVADHIVITSPSNATKASDGTYSYTLTSKTTSVALAAKLVDSAGKDVSGSVKWTKISGDNFNSIASNAITAKSTVQDNNTCVLKVESESDSSIYTTLTIKYSAPKETSIKVYNSGVTGTYPAYALTMASSELTLSAAVVDQSDTAMTGSSIIWAIKTNNSGNNFTLNGNKLSITGTGIKSGDQCVLTATSQNTAAVTCTLTVKYSPSKTKGTLDYKVISGGVDVDNNLSYEVTGDTKPGSHVTITAVDAGNNPVDTKSVYHNDSVIIIPASIAKKGTKFTFTYSTDSVEASDTYTVSDDYHIDINGIENNSGTSTIHFQIIGSDGKTVKLNDASEITVVDSKGYTPTYTVNKDTNTITVYNPVAGEQYTVVYKNASNKTASVPVTISNTYIKLTDANNGTVSGGVYGLESTVNVAVTVNGVAYNPTAGQIYVRDSSGKVRSECIHNHLLKTVTFPRTLEAGTYYVCFANENGMITMTPYLISGSDAFTGGFNVSSANLDIANAGKSVAFKIYVYNKGNTQVDYSKVSGNAYITGSSNITLASTNVTVLATGAYITVNLGRNLTAGETAKVNINLYYDNMRVYENAGLSRFQYLNISTFFNGSYANTDVNSTIDTTSSNVVTTAERGKTATDSLLTVKSDGGAKVLAFDGTRRTEIEAVIPATVKVGNETLLVTSISAQAFKGNKVIKRVFIPSTVTKIGKGAFRGAKRIKKIVIAVDDAYDLEIAKNAFRDLTKDTKVIIYSWDTEDYYRTIEKIKKAGGHNLKFVRKNMSNYE